MPTSAERIAQRHLRALDGNKLLHDAAALIREANEQLHDAVLLLEGHQDADAPVSFSREAAGVVNELRHKVSADLERLAGSLSRVHGARSAAGIIQAGEGVALAGGSPMNLAKMDISTKTRISRAFHAAGLDGNGRFEKPDKGYVAAVNILADFDIEIAEIVNSHVFMQPNGRTTVDLASTNHKDSFSPTAIEDSMLVLTWHKFEETDKYEVIAYLS